jgi:hypothetical protein
MLYPTLQYLLVKCLSQRDKYKLLVDNGFLMFKTKRSIGPHLGLGYEKLSQHWG